MGQTLTRFPDRHSYEVLGLVRLSDRTHNFRGRKREFLSESPVRENRPPGSMSGE
jgi:hypothetical protein